MQWRTLTDKHIQTHTNADKHIETHADIHKHRQTKHKSAQESKQEHKTVLHDAPWHTTTGHTKHHQTPHPQNPTPCHTVLHHTIPKHQHSMPPTTHPTHTAKQLARPHHGRAKENRREHSTTRSSPSSAFLKDYCTLLSEQSDCLGLPIVLRSLFRSSRCSRRFHFWFFCLQLRSVAQSRRPASQRARSSRQVPEFSGNNMEQLSRCSPSCSRLWGFFCLICLFAFCPDFTYFHIAFLIWFCTMMKCSCLTMGLVYLFAVFVLVSPTCWPI